MVWDLVATVATGFHAGAGLGAAVTGCPSATDSEALRSFTRRSRWLSITLASVGCGSAIATHTAEQRGPLWLVAAAAVGISIPFNLLLMSPPHPVHLAGRGFKAGPDGDLEAVVEALDGPEEESEPGAAVSADEALDDAASLGGTSAASARSSRRAGSRRHAKSSIYYARAGVLVNPDELRASWTRKYWFQAGVATAAFVGMIVVLSSHKDEVTYGGYAPM